MQTRLKGILIHTDHFGWQVRYEYGKGQSKAIAIHPNSIQGVKEFGMEGEEVHFEIKGTNAPRTINGSIPSALIVLNEKNSTD
jgi:hypothetical protein